MSPRQNSSTRNSQSTLTANTHKAEQGQEKVPEHNVRSSSWLSQSLCLQIFMEYLVLEPRKSKCRQQTVKVQHHSSLPNLKHDNTVPRYQGSSLFNGSKCRQPFWKLCVLQHRTVPGNPITMTRRKKPHAHPQINT